MITFMNIFFNIKKAAIKCLIREAKNLIDNKSQARTLNIIDVMPT